MVDSDKRTWHWGAFGNGLLLSLALMIGWGVVGGGLSYVESKASCTALQEKLSPDGKMRALVYREEAYGFDARELVVAVPAAQEFRPKGVMSKSLADGNEPDLCCLILGRADVDVKWKQNDRLLIQYSLEREGQTIIQRSRVPHVEKVALEYSSKAPASLH